MKTKLLTLAALLLTLCLCAACALGATANAVIVAPQTAKITAPFAGTLLPFDLTQGEEVAAGDLLFKLDTTPVYAPIAGKVAAVFAAAGDDASGVIGHYGAIGAENVSVELEGALSRYSLDADHSRLDAAAAEMVSAC